MASKRQYMAFSNLECVALSITLMRRLVRRNPPESGGIGMVNSIDQIPSCCLVAKRMKFNSMNSFICGFAHSFSNGMELNSIPSNLLLMTKMPSGQRQPPPPATATGNHHHRSPPPPPANTTTSGHRHHRQPPPAPATTTTGNHHHDRQPPPPGTGHRPVTTNHCHHRHQ